MKKELSRIVIAVLVLALASVACNFSASTANIRDAYMARDNAGADRTTVFAAEDVFYCIVEVANAPDDTTVKAIWYAVDVEGMDRNSVIGQIETAAGQEVIPFILSNENLWPAGKYKVEIYLNNELDTTLRFKVK